MQLAWKVEAGSNVKLQDYDPGYVDEHTDPALARAELQQLGAELGELQELLAAAHYHSLLIVLQGMDASGKAGSIREVMAHINPQGCQVRSFKVPTLRELDHDFLWRVHRATPGKGMVGIFNRSHYEDVLVVRAHSLVPETVWRQRYAAINNFEHLLAQNDMRKDAYTPGSRIKWTRGNSPPPIGKSANTGTLIKKPMKRHSPSAVRMKLPGISCLRTTNGTAICWWHAPSFTLCASTRRNGSTD